VHLSLLSFAAGTSITHAIVYSSSEAIATPTALSSPAAPCPPGVPAPLVLAIIAPTWAGGSPTSPPEEKKEEKSVNSRFTLYACPEPVLANDLFFQELLDKKNPNGFQKTVVFSLLRTDGEIWVVQKHAVRPRACRLQIIIELQVNIHHSAVRAKQPRLQ
jgi:hypothetical protein